MKVVGYCRYSSEAQRDGYSIQAQMREIEEFCKKNEYSLIGTYIDEAKSGTTTDKRDQFKKMIDDSKRGDFKAVVVHKLDRFARDRYDSAMYRKLLRDNGVKIISITEPLDDSPESVIMESLLEGMAEYYSKNLSRETKKGKREAARKGQYTGGGIPFGYRVNEHNRFEIVPEEAEIIRALFKKIDDGTTLYQTAKWAVQQGFLNKNGNFINIYFLRHMLRNPIYAGRMVYGKKPHTGEGEFYVDNACEPIIDPDLFWKHYHAAMSRNTGPSPKTKKNHFVLTGFLRCGECGAHLKGYSKSYKQTSSEGNLKYKYERYRCSKSVTSKRHFEPGHPEKCNLKMIDKKTLEDHVLKNIKETFFTDESLTKIAEKVYHNLYNRSAISSDQLRSTKRDIEKINSYLDKLLELYVEEKITKKQYDDKRENYLERLEDLQRRIPLENIKESNMKISVGAIKKAIIAMNDRDFHDGTPEERREMITAFVDSIIVTNEAVDIKFKINFSGSVLVPNGGVEGI